MIDSTTVLVRDTDVIIICDSYEDAKAMRNLIEELNDYREKYRQARQIIKEWWLVDGFMSDDLMSRIEKILRYDEEFDK